MKRIPSTDTLNVKRNIRYGCETWSLKLREEHRLRVSEQGAEQNIWAQEGRNDVRLEKIA